MKKLKIFASLLFILLVLILPACARPTQQFAATELLDLGEKYLLELNYEQAIVQFAKLIEIEPKNQRAYLGAAEAYIALGRTEEAIEILSQGYNLTEDAAIKAMIDELTTWGDTAVPLLITSLTISGLAAPIAGTAPDKTITVNTGVSIQNGDPRWWYSEDAQRATGDGSYDDNFAITTFEVGKTPYAVIKLFAQRGYEFDTTKFFVQNPFMGTDIIAVDGVEHVSVFIVYADQTSVDFVLQFS